MILSLMIPTVTFPMLARSMATGDEEGSRERLDRDLRIVSAVILVAAAYLIVFAEPIIRLLFQQGAFTAQDTAATADIMRVYAFGLLGQAAVGVLSRSYFSQRRSIWYPALVMAAGLALTVVVSLVLLQQWNGMALAAGNAAGITLTAGLLLTGLSRRVLPVSLPASDRPLDPAPAHGRRGRSGWMAGQPPPVRRVSATGGHRRRTRDAGRVRGTRHRVGSRRDAPTGRRYPGAVRTPAGRPPPGADVPLGRHR